MNGLSLYTSGSTDEPKEIFHSWESLTQFAQLSIDEIKLTKDDVVLDVFPGNTIAHFTVTAYPAILSRASLHTAVFNPYTYLESFEKINPTYIALIPKHYELLTKTKKWKTIDMSSVRYMVTGSGPVTQQMIDDFRDRGVQTVANWYGMTEVPPPVMIAYNSEVFTKKNYNIDFAEDGECIIDGWKTGDIFNSDMTYKCRKVLANGRTWKNNI